MLSTRPAAGPPVANIGSIYGISKLRVSVPQNHRVASPQLSPFSVCVFFLSLGPGNAPGSNTRPPRPGLGPRPMGERRGVGDLKERQARDGMKAVLEKVKKAYPDKPPIMDPVGEMGITDQNFKKVPPPPPLPPLAVSLTGVSRGPHREGIGFLYTDVFFVVPGFWCVLNEFRCCCFPPGFLHCPNIPILSFPQFLRSLPAPDHPIPLEPPLCRISTTRFSVLFIIYPFNINFPWFMVIRFKFQNLSGV